MAETETRRARSKPLSWAAMTLIFTNIGLGGLVLIAVCSFGSLESALDYLKGNRLIPEGHSKSFGTMAIGEERVITVGIRNALHWPVRILGAKTRCSCVHIADHLPMTLPPDRVSAVHVRIQPKVEKGRVAEPIHLFTDYSPQPSLTLTVVGDVLNK